MMDTATSLNKMLEDKLDQTEIKIVKDPEYFCVIEIRRLEV